MSILAVDVGGTNIRLAICDDAGNIIARHKVEAQLSNIHAASSAEVANMLTQLLSDCFQPFIAQYHPSRIGIGFPGFFAGDTGILLSSPNIPLLQNYDLASAIQAATNLPTHVQNDALCAAWGEFKHGIGAQLATNSLMHITLGTGVGAGLILNAQPYAGEHGMAMEFGHLHIAPLAGDEATTCGCGNTSCLETYASATALSNIYAKLTGEQIPAQEVAQKAIDKDCHAAQVIHHAGLYLGAAIAESSKLLDIKNITISGGMTGCWDLLFPAMSESLHLHLIAPLRGKIAIHRSQLGDDAGLWGAARLNSD